MNSFIRFYLALLITSGAAFSQGIAVKTVPLLSTDQFSLVPSFRDDMGGVSIAIRDGVPDLFINPGKFDSTTRTHWFTAPRLNHWGFSQETTTRFPGTHPSNSLVENQASSSIFSLPVGLFLRGHRLYSGAMFAIQSLTANNWQSIHFNAINYPVAWFGGCYLPALKLAIGAGVNYVRIGGIDGVYQLYPNARRLSQEGSARQFRLGFSGKWNGNDQWSLLGSRYFFNILQTEQNIENRDQHNGWLVQLDYIKTMSQELALGFLFTADWRHHPKIPEYPLAGIPRDPGNTHAFNFGLGLKWQNEVTLIGLDMIYQPIDVKTWAEAATDMELWDGRIIRKGDVTMRNDYQFHNRILRSGVQVKPMSWLSLATGAQVQIYQYDYYQNDFINRVERTGKPQRQWSEVTWTNGIKFTTGKFEIFCSTRMQIGAGLLERQWLGWWFAESTAMDFARADFFIPPTIPLNVNPVIYYTHWLGLRYYF